MLGIIGSVNQFQLKLLCDKTREGLDPARGKFGGLPVNLNVVQVEMAIKLRSDGKSVAAVASLLNVSPPKGITDKSLRILCRCNRFFLTELGDKTMLATVTLATTEGWFGTWIGSALGMVAADALAIGVGVMLGKALPGKVIKIGALLIYAGVTV
jgi:putative Ca2+/H+ antiporter (TMEM165/GDT1 family)